MDAGGAYRPGVHVLERGLHQGKLRFVLKDEEEFAEAVAKGAYDEASVRVEGERVLCERPWPTGWEDWSPPPAWSETPQLVAGWDVV